MTNNDAHQVVFERVDMCLNQLEEQPATSLMDEHRWLVSFGVRLGCLRGDGQLTRSAPGTSYFLPEYGGIGDGNKFNTLMADVYSLCPESCGLLGGYTRRTSVEHTFFNNEWVVL